MTPYGVLANLGAMPVVSALVMPAGLLGLLAAPFGLDGVCWWVMGIGIDWMVAVSRWVAALPGAVGRIPAFGTAPLIAASLGIIVMGLLRTPLRWSGALVLLAAILWGLSVRQPDILIAGDGASVAVRGRDGHLHMIRASKDGFLLKEWLAADADPRDTGSASLADGVSCDESGCVTSLADGRLVALALRVDALADDCSRAALVVTARPASPDCAAMVVDRQRLARQGSLALTQRGGGFVVQAVKARGTNRPLVAGDRRRWRFRIEPHATVGCSALQGRNAAGGRPSGRGLKSTFQPIGRRVMVGRLSAMICGLCSRSPTGWVTGSCSTVARWPSTSCVTSTYLPSGNSIAS